jgi:hypothetical protein
MMMIDNNPQQKTELGELLKEKHNMEIQTEIQKKLESAGFKSLSEYQEVHDKFIERLVIEDECTVDVKGLTEVVQFKTMLDIATVKCMAGGTYHLWVHGLITPENHLSFATDNFLTAVKELQAIQQMPIEGLHIHLFGFKPVFQMVHPHYLNQLKSGKIGFTVDKMPNPKTTKLPVHLYDDANKDEKKNRMVAISLVYYMDRNNRVGIKKCIMDADESNFRPIPHGHKVCVASDLMPEDFDIMSLPAWKRNWMQDTKFTSGEHIIHSGKSAAAAWSMTYHFSSPASITHRFGQPNIAKKWITMKLKDFNKVGIVINVDGDDHCTVEGKVETPKRKEMGGAGTFAKMMALINEIIYCKMETCEDPAMMKKLGRLCLLNVDLYFPNMDCKKPNEMANVLFDEYGYPQAISSFCKQDIGANAKIMKVGLLLRLLHGDEHLANNLKLCKKHNMIIIEGAVHGDEKVTTTTTTMGDNMTMTMKTSVLHPRDPDEKWGETACNMGMSPVFDLVTFVDPTTGLRLPNKFYGALGLGSNMTVEELPDDMCVTKEMCWYAILDMLNSIVD